MHSREFRLKLCRGMIVMSYVYAVLCGLTYIPHRKLAFFLMGLAAISWLTGKFLEAWEQTRELREKDKDLG